MPVSDHERLHAATRIAVYGFGREGQAVVRYLERIGVKGDVEVLVDEPLDDADRHDAAQLGVEVHAGYFAAAERLASDAPDVLVRSPGVRLSGAGITTAREHGVHVTTGTNLWFEAEAPDNVVAITGTKGKSTTCALLGHLLRSSGRDVAVLGNIGAALLDHGAKASSHDVVVVELSSFQLADLHQPLSVGVWLNVHHEHVDWHGSHAAYVADKARIVELADRLVANHDDTEVAAAAAVHDRVDWVAADSDPVMLDGNSFPRSRLAEAADASALVGDHQVANLAMALAAGATVGADPAKLLEHVATFTPLPHRLELVHDDGRRWVDDSIATIPESAVAGLRAFPDQPVTLLAGGYDRSQDHGPLVDEVVERGDVTVVTLPETGERLRDELASHGVDAQPATDLADAVAIADACTPPGGVVLLSPAAPSFGQFHSFEERGERFAALARDRGKP